MSVFSFRLTASRQLLASGFDCSSDDKDVHLLDLPSH